MSKQTSSEKSPGYADRTCQLLDHQIHARACMCQYREETVKYVKRGVVVCLFLTIVSLTACCVTVRSALFTREQVQIFREWKRQIGNKGISCGQMKIIASEVTADEDTGHDDVLQPDLQWDRDIHNIVKRKAKKTRKGKGKGRKDKNKKFCKKVSKCPAQPSPDQPKNSLTASHFTVDGTTVSGQIIGALQPAHWIHANVEQAATSSDNEVSVTESGVYLVYSTVLFNDTKFREGLVVKKNNIELFKCFDGVDHIDNRKSRKQNFKFKTCSVSGVTYLSEGDKLKMVNLYPDTNLDTSEGSTFFGLIQLIPASK